LHSCYVSSGLSGLDYPEKAKFRRGYVVLGFPNPAEMARPMVLSQKLKFVEGRPRQENRLRVDIGDPHQQVQIQGAAARCLAS
jgi:hypothetical protein